MSCSELNDDLDRIGVTNSPSCSCGATKENMENAFHFFMTCPNYSILRQQHEQLHADIIKHAKYSIGTILYGDKTKCVKTNSDIVHLVHSFIMFIINSNRFQ